MSTHNRCFVQKYEKYQNFLSENFHFLVVKYSILLNRRVFVMNFQYFWISMFSKWRRILRMLEDTFIVWGGSLALHYENTIIQIY